MTVAAVYARYSSDAQRDESIEIQVEQCAALIEREGWEMGEVYADYAKTGTNDNRPAFRRCIADGSAGLFDVLVIYKTDRFARNVEVSRRYKRELRAAGVRIVSVREGEMPDTPDGMLGEGVAELFAEYYSRNLSVLVKGGIRKSAELGLAAGVRIYGYRTGEDGRFAEEAREAEVVRSVFAAYLGGESTTRIAERLERDGVPTVRGGRWRPQGISKMLRNDAYAGVYRYAGVEIPGGMPAIIGRRDFDMVQAEMDARRDHRSAARRSTEDYSLTGRLFCAIDGRPMGGYSGTGKAGRKYCYYRDNGGCGLSVPKDAIEGAVVSELVALLREDGSVDRMVEEVMRSTAAKPDRTRELEAELAEVRKQAENVVSAIARCGDLPALTDALPPLQARMDDIEMELARARFDRTEMVDPAKVRAMVREIVERIDRDPSRAADAVAAFVDKIYTDGESIMVVFDLGDGAKEFDLGTVQGIIKGELPDEQGVRLIRKWCAVRDSNPRRTDS